MIYMKTLIHKLFTVLICTFAFACVQSFAQGLNYEVETKTLPVSEFNSLSVEDDFEVTLLKGPQSVKVTSNRDLMPYIQVYVRGKVLYITFDEKSLMGLRWPTMLRSLLQIRSPATIASI